MRVWVHAFTVAIVVVGPAVFFTPTRANACSCASPKMSRVTLPGDGISNFPVDGAIRIFVSATSREIRQGLIEEYRLRDKAGSLVPLTGSVEQTMITLRSRSALSPLTRYVLERVYAFSERGDRLSDDDRLEIAQFTVRPFGETPGRVGSRRWFPELSFTTGTGPSAPAVAPKVVDAKIYFAYGGGDCGPGTSLAIRYRLPAGSPNDVFGIEVEGRGVLHWFDRSQGRRIEADEPGIFRTGLGDMLCGPDPVHLAPSEEYRVRLVAAAANGIVAREQSWTRVTAPKPYSAEWALKMGASARSVGMGSERAEVLADIATEREASDLRLAAEFFAAPIVEAADPAKVAAGGPKGCAFGLERRQSVPLPAGKLPWMSGAEASIGWRRGRLYTIYEDEASRRAEVLEAKLDGTARQIKLPSPADETVAVFAEDGMLVASTVFEGSERSTIRVSMLDYAGGRRWERSLEGEAVEWHPRLAWGERHVLVVWEGLQLDAKPPLIRWATLDAGDGTLVMQNSVATAPKGDANTVPAIASEGVGFRLAWLEGRALGDRSPARLRVGRISGEGELTGIEDLGSDPVRGLRWAVDGGRTALAITGPERSRVLLWTDQARSAPRTVLLAGGSSPTLTTRGELYVLGMNTRQGASLTVFDDQGKIGPSTSLGLGEVSSPLVVGSDQGVVAVYAPSNGQGPIADRFECRSNPSDQAPDRISSP